MMYQYIFTLNGDKDMVVSGFFSSSEKAENHALEYTYEHFKYDKTIVKYDSEEHCDVCYYFNEIIRDNISEDISPYFNFTLVR